MRNDLTDSDRLLIIRSDQKNIIREYFVIHTLQISK